MTNQNARELLLREQEKVLSVNWETPGSPMVKTPMLPTPGAQVPSLLGELRSHMLHGQKKCLLKEQGRKCFYFSLQKRDQIRGRCGLNIRNNINGSNLLQKIVGASLRKKDYHLLKTSNTKQIRLGLEF